MNKKDQKTFLIVAAIAAVAWYAYSENKKKKDGETKTEEEKEKTTSTDQISKFGGGTCNRNYSLYYRSDDIRARVQSLAQTIQEALRTKYNVSINIAARKLPQHYRDRSDFSPSLRGEQLMFIRDCRVMDGPKRELINGKLHTIFIPNVANSAYVSPDNTYSLYPTLGTLSTTLGMSDFVTEVYNFGVR